MIISQQRLSAKPSTAYIKIDMQNTFQEIEMIAENLGKIPPNTALLMVTAGTKRYRLYLTSTEVKSAKVRFVYDSEAAGRTKSF
jgi:nicotinamidase-related amidase